MVHADGSIFQTWRFLRETGLQGFINLWPRPSFIACKIIFCYGVFEAVLQLLLPGKRVEGPISPTGNRPVYKVYYRCSIDIHQSCLPIDFTRLLLPE